MSATPAKNSEWICTLAELVKAIGGRVHSQVAGEFRGVGTDSRKSLKDLLFIPLKGENFDAHDFVPKAVEQGASAILISSWREEWKELAGKVSFIEVGDTLKALQDLANFWRRKHAFRVLGITGSNGKTSTKEFTYALLKDDFRVHASKGSFNNHWGVPLSILSAAPDQEILILEMGMNHSGEIKRLCEIAAPDVVVVTTVGTGHIGELGSQEAIAAAKEEIYQNSAGAIQIFNLDNEWTVKMQSRSDAAKLLFSSREATADVNLRLKNATAEGLEIEGQIRTVQGHATVPVWGAHNLVNIMVASALGLAVGMPPEQVWSGLPKIRSGAWGRNQVVELENGARVLFDAYNSNPDSVEALFANVKAVKVSGRTYLIFGDMRELGSMSESAHEKAGELAARIGFAGIWYVGEFGRAFERGLAKGPTPPEKFWCSLKTDASISKELFALLKSGDLVVVKGSRGMELEHAIESWPAVTPLGKKH